MRLLFLIFATVSLAWLAFSIYQKDASAPRAEVSSTLDLSRENTLQAAPEFTPQMPGLTFAPGLNYGAARNYADYSGQKKSAVTNELDDSAAGNNSTLVAQPTAIPISVVTLLWPSPAATVNSTAEPQIAPSALISSLQDLQTASGNGRSNPGVRSSNNRPGLIATITPTATPDGQLPWVGGQSTGYAMLALMHPRARAMAQAQVEILFKARIRNPFLAVLADGTFDYDAEALLSAVRRLSADERQLTVLLYLSSGPTMRRWDSTPITAAFARIDPDSFRYAMQFDDTVRAKYRGIAERALTLTNSIAAISQQAKVLVVPSLEDNLDADGYRAIQTISKDVFANNASIVRNICPGCWPGNDTNALGDPLEGHTEALLERLGPGDVFTLDGLGHSYENENDNSQASEAAIKLLKELAIEREVGYFGLWRKQRQGLGTQLIHPDERTYEVPSASQAEADINLLRYGLELE